MARRPDDTKQKSIFERHRFLSSVAIFVVILFVLAIVLEVALRIFGVSPTASQYDLVDELVVYDRFMTDETGMLKMNPNFDNGEHVSINADGFRDEDIQTQLQSGLPRIMFVGDSFTYGASAEPITQSFADRIEEHGYTAFSFGVAGTGPVQYAKIVETYLDVVEPDFLAVMVYLGNDVNKFPMRLESGKVPFYSTNADMIYAFDRHGNHMTPQEAYDYYCADMYAKLEYYSRKSALLYSIGKRLVGLRNQIRMRRHRAGSGSGDRNQYVKDSLGRIERMADDAGVRCVFFLLPAQPSRRHDQNEYESTRSIFDGLPTVYVDFSENEYDTETAHFNNAGHAKMIGIVREVVEDPASSLVVED